MDEHAQHFVQKFVFDIQYHSEEKAHHFQNQLATFLKEKIVPLTDEVLTEVTNGFLLSLEKITLDLGEIPEEHFESEVYNRIKSKLFDKIHLLLSGYIAESPDEQLIFLSRELTDLQKLEFFLENGYFSWNTQIHETNYSVKKLISDLLENSPQKLRFLIEEKISNKVVLLRLIRQVEDDLLWKVIQLWNIETGFIKRSYSEFTSLFRQKPIIKNTYSEFRDLLWSFILEEVLIKKKVNFETIKFTEDLIQYVSEETKIEYYNVLLSFYLSLNESIEKSITDAPQGILDSITNIIRNNDLSDLSKKLPGKGDNESITEKRVKKEENPDDDLRAREKQSASENKEDRHSDQYSEPSPEEKQKRKEQQDQYDEQDPWSDKRKEEEIAQRQEQKEKERKNLESFLRKFLNLKHQIFAVEKLQRQELISEVESIIKDLVYSNPSFIKSSFLEAGLVIDEPDTIRFLEIFSEEIRLQILKNVYQTELAEFDKMKLDAEMRNIQRFLETGDLSVYERSRSKAELKEFEKRLIELALAKTEWFKAIFRRAIIESSDKEFKIAQLYKKISVGVVKRLFVMAGQEAEIVEKGKLKNQVSIATKLSDINTPENAIYHIEYFLKAKPSSEVQKNSEVTFENVVIKLFEKYTSVALSFFLSLKEKEQKFALQAVKNEEKLKAIMNIVSGHKKTLDELLTQIKQSKAIHDEAQLKDPKSADKKVSPEQNDPLINALYKQATSTPESDYKPSQFEYKKLESGEPIYINNAGLVIAHPYLSRFFKMLNLLEGRVFKDAFSAHKAAHILQYLVNKNTSSEEHEMVLNKLICGIDLSEPLLRDIELSEEEKNTCEGLLEGVIQNWAILKKTSNDNFRSSFLIRNGRLVLESKGWKLKVEEKAYDILVEKLPWSISMIKMPWMKNIIYVEWK